MATTNNKSKQTVVLRAPLLTKSGYGEHARQIASWLFSHSDKFDIYVELLPWGMTPWITSPNQLKGNLFNQILEASNKKLDFYDLSIQVQLPNEWNPFLAMTNVGVTAGVETDRCHPDWVECVNRMSKVIAPSEFTKQTFLNSGNVTTDIEVVPIAYDSELLTPTARPLELSLKTSFNFLSVGMLTGNSPETDRKNLLYMLKWFCESFSDKPDVGLILKTSSVRLTHLDRAYVTNVLNSVLTNIGLKENPKIYLLHGDLSTSEMAALYQEKTVKAFLLPTHGEGFGIPVLEAAVSGLLVIATNWSAHTEFLNKGKWLSVSSSLVPVPQARIDNKIFVPGAQWAQPSEREFKERLVKFYEQPQKPKQWAAELSKVLIPLYSSELINTQYSSSILPLLTNQ